MHNHKGITLLEVIISLAILTGLLITLIYTLNYHLSVAERQNIITLCTFIAKEKINEMEKSPISTKGYLDEPYTGFSYETFVLDSKLPSMLEIRVKVSKDKESVILSQLIKKR
ncbi:MAG: prepilin-type N-terminal cleavage/methylation domain-containing protein [Thermodesulfovibrionales bacterium]|nr:prepilin-type N-terminal cleavage/methylation domain-containing protein [Thermodesulfovibrionales bacterium]